MYKSLPASITIFNNALYLLSNFRSAEDILDGCRRSHPCQRFDALLAIWVIKSDFSFESQQGSHVDIAPTILDLLNIPIPDYYMGKSLISDPYTFPLGRDGRIGYIMANSQYYPFALFDSESLLNNNEFMIYVDPNNIQSLNKQLDKQLNKQYDNSNYYTKWYKSHF